VGNILKRRRARRAMQVTVDTLLERVKAMAPMLRAYAPMLRAYAPMLRAYAAEAEAPG
jgi:hypothetical protein